MRAQGTVFVCMQGPPGPSPWPHCPPALARASRRARWPLESALHTDRWDPRPHRPARIRCCGAELSLPRSGPPAPVPNPRRHCPPVVKLGTGETKAFLHAQEAAAPPAWPGRKRGGSPPRACTSARSPSLWGWRLAEEGPAPWPLPGLGGPSPRQALASQPFPLCGARAARGPSLLPQHPCSPRIKCLVQPSKSRPQNGPGGGGGLR